MFKRTKKKLILSCYLMIISFGLTFLSCSVSAEQVTLTEKEKGLYLVGNIDNASAVLKVANEKIRVSGRTSFYCSASDAQLEAGKLQVNGFSLAFFGVPQQFLAGKIITDKKSGVLGFAALGKPQDIKYDRGTGKITGEIHGYVDAAYMSALIKGPVKDDKIDLFETVKQPATVLLDMKIEDSLKSDIEKLHYEKTVINISCKANRITYEDDEIAPFELSELVTDTEIEIAPWWWFEVAKTLCVQPVRIGKPVKNPSSSLPLFEMTGDGFSFGQPAAVREWKKADVIFNFRSWKTLWKSSYWKVDTAGDATSTEQLNLRNEIDDDDCIEVYFIDEFIPVSWAGAGATWGSGKSTAKIITSDANAAGGVDFNHLAHELGHVMGLLHPESEARIDAVPASSGTLMCPSGYLKDNPSVNSQENKESLSNPLFRFAMKRVSSVPDCQNDMDCDPCP